ncbi:MAG: DUF72 domain-containing protein [Deltaproteobacteria bacterium]|nr:DUF72 domain-containing protein [Deltaproteobacteria bacterium]
MANRQRIHIGTSGWHYGHWKGPFYPRSVASEDFLKFYCQKFHTTEINNSFYRLPESSTLKTWKDTVPSDFIFAAKASRYITHMKKLKDPEESLAKFMERMTDLGEKLGPILFQLPPHWSFNAERLRSFLAALPQNFRFALEFRDPRWINDETFQVLADRGAAFCIFEIAGYLSPKEVTADFVYIRLHGPDGAYAGSYDRETLAKWARDIRAWTDRGKDVFCYFDNDQAGYAAQNALELQEMLAED